MYLASPNFVCADRLCSPPGTNKKKAATGLPSERRADDGIRTHDINLGKVALYH